MKTLADRFRRWYDFERDCNAKTLGMLESVPADVRGSPAYQRAVGRMSHLDAARQRWLVRLGGWSEMPGLFPPVADLDELRTRIARTEAAWVAYLEKLDDAELSRPVMWEAMDGRRFRWDAEGILTQTFGHAFYHRGQIAQLVAELGGKAVDTDYLYWCQLPEVEKT